MLSKAQKVKRIFWILIPLGLPLLLPLPAYASASSQVGNFTNATLITLSGVAVLACVFFLIRAGYLYMTSSGKPEALLEAKQAIHSALIGLALVIGAGIIYSIFHTSFSQPAIPQNGTALKLTPISPTSQDGSLTKILLDAISGFLQNIVQSGAKPILDAIIGFLTNTPMMASNSVVFNFWLIIVGITDSLFALVIALLGFQIMSASTFGFEEISFKQLLPRIGLSFLVANTSIFIIDWLILLCQTLVKSVLDSTGGIEKAWIITSFNPATLANGTALLIVLIFMVVFMFLSALLLLFYIGRLIVLAFGAVISPLICLLWLIPKTAGFAETTIKAYLVALFSIFIHVVIIQLASAFLTLPGQSGNNAFISVFVGIALFAILLKSTAITLQFALASQAGVTLKSFGLRLLNSLNPSHSSKETPVTYSNRISELRRQRWEEPNR